MMEKSLKINKKRHVTPSRLRYEERNPVVSFRIDRARYLSLKATIGKSGMSEGQFFRRIIDKGVLDLSTAREKGYKKGFRTAKEKYGLRYICNVCLDDGYVKGDQLKKINQTTLEGVYAFHRKCKTGPENDESELIFD